MGLIITNYTNKNHEKHDLLYPRRKSMPYGCSMDEPTKQKCKVTVSDDAQYLAQKCGAYRKLVHCL